MDPAATERSYIEAVSDKDRVGVFEICDVVLGLIFPDCRNKAAVAKVCDGGVEIIRVFFPQNSFQLLAMITGAGPEVLITVEDIEDLDLHIGQLTGHVENYVSI